MACLPQLQRHLYGVSRVTLTFSAALSRCARVCEWMSVPASLQPPPAGRAEARKVVLGPAPRRQVAERRLERRRTVAVGAHALFRRAIAVRREATLPRA